MSKWTPKTSLSFSRASTLAKPKDKKDGTQKGTNTPNKSHFIDNFLIPNGVHLCRKDMSIKPDSDLAQVQEYLAKLLKEDRDDDALAIFMDLLSTMRQKK